MELSIASLAGKVFTLRMESVQAAVKVDSSLTQILTSVNNALQLVPAASVYTLQTVSPAATLLLRSVVAIVLRVVRVAISHITITAWITKNAAVFQDAGSAPTLDFATNVCLITLELQPANTLT